MKKHILATLLVVSGLFGGDTVISSPTIHMVDSISDLSNLKGKKGDLVLLSSGNSIKKYIFNGTSWISTTPAQSTSGNETYIVVTGESQESYPNQVQCPKGFSLISKWNTGHSLHYYSNTFHSQQALCKKN